MISIVKYGIRHKKIRHCRITAKSVTGSELRVRGTQKVSVNIGDTRVYHDFVVADLEAKYDELIRVDLM